MNKFSFIFYSGMENIGFLDVSEDAFNEFVKVVDPKYRGDVVNMYMYKKDDIYRKLVIMDCNILLMDVQQFFL